MKKEINFQTGFTFVELIIVIAITLLIGITAVPFYSRFFNQTAVANTTTQLIAELRKAQTYSMTGKRGGQWGVTYTNSSIILFQGSTYASRNAAFDETFSIDPNVSITGFTELAFNRMTGTPSASQSITISGIGGNSQTVAVSTQGVIINTAWFNTSFVYRKTITIDHTKVVGGSDLSNFPVLISITDPNLRTVANGGFVQNTSGYDILFTDTTQTIKLDHEIEKYDPTTGEIDMWVRLPVLYANTDTVLSMYYDNTAISSSQENKNSVWDTNYVGVWHLNDNAANTTVSDSTAIINTGTNAANTSTKTVSGQIAGGLTFNGSTDKTVTTTNGSIKGQAGVTVSAWVNTTALSGLQQEIYMESTNGTSATSRLALTINGGTSKFEFFGRTADADARTSWVSSSTALTTNTWYYVVAVYDSANSLNHLMVNGVDQTSAKTEAAFSSTTPTSAPYIGAQADATQFWNGRLDEVRVSKTARTAGWNTTEYNNQSSPSTFYTIGLATTQ
ncbi:MAG TPA: DUF2341 domain-containing protein [Candidatus Saccharimonadales bacterium]|nr:DUF2341 domain-containing protein [Candidatus Saccharimonadales bacterium]